MRLLLVGLTLAFSATFAKAQQHEMFDYYVMALSWSPSWCAREGDARGSDQCDPRHDHGWILHGLWPQFDTGYPEFCQTPHRPPSRQMTRAMSDIMGTSGLAWHEWKKHGSCTGLSAEDYFLLSRKAYAMIERPDLLRRLGRDVRIAPEVIEEAFQQVNPDLAKDQITITCRDGYIQDARLCLTKDLTPRQCGRDVLRDCTAKTARLPAIR
ncbi:MAG: ribonuclease T2 [Pseudomonadota bacterium]